MKTCCEKTSVEWHHATSREDARIIAGLANEVWTEHYVPLIGADQVVYMLERFQSSEQIYLDISENGMHYLWLSTNNKPVAYMAWQEKPAGNCFLSKLYVLKSHRGLGLARMMMKELIAVCQKNKYLKIWLTVNKGNSKSIEAYKKMMFSIRDVVVTDIGGGFVMDDFIMERDLSTYNINN